MYPFYLFELDHDASDQQVADRYHELLAIFPPDTAPEQFAMVRRAYDALLDERVRVKTRLFYFDQTGRSLSEQYAKWFQNKPRTRMNPEQLSSFIKQESGSWEKTNIE